MGRESTYSGKGRRCVESSYSGEERRWVEGQHILGGKQEGIWLIYSGEGRGGY